MNEYTNRMQIDNRNDTHKNLVILINIHKNFESLYHRKVFDKKELDIVISLPKIKCIKILFTNF